MGTNGTVAGDRRKEYKEKNYVLVPPEGGWGFVVCVGLSISFIAATAQLPCLGFIYREFLEERGEGTSVLAVVQGVYNFMTSVTGFTANIALKRFSLRAVGICGALIITTGAFLCIFIQTTLHLIIAHSVLQGGGLGIMLPILYTSFNSYFTVKKVLYLSLCKASIGLAIMLYPLLIKIMMEEFGFRGTLAIISALTANALVGAMVMQPVEWHMIKKPKECEMILVIPPTPAVESNSNGFKFENPLISDKKSTITKSAENLKPLLAAPISEDTEKFQQLLRLPIYTGSRRSSTPVIGIGANRRSSAIGAVLDERFDSTDDVYMQNVMKAVSMSSLGNFGNLPPLPPIKNRQGKWQTIMEYFDFTLLKDPVYANIAIGMPFSFFADIMFFALEPLLLGHYGYNGTQISNTIAVGGATDMIGKLALGLVGQFFLVNSRYVFFAGSLLPAITRTIFLQFSDYIPVLVMTGFLGLLRSMVHITMPIVLAGYIPIERYPAAFGLMMLIYGFVNITIGPVIGIVRDMTGSYALAFHLLTACNLMCVVPWTVEALLSFRKTKNNGNKEIK